MTLFRDSKSHIEFCTGARTDLLPRGTASVCASVILLLRLSSTTIITMPVPAVAMYVAVAVGTAVTLVVFKELVYDPHIAPKVNAWRETRAQQRRHLVPVLVRSTSNLNSPKASSSRQGLGKKSSDHESSDDDDGNGVSVEMEELVAKETAEWQSRGQNTTLRHRRGRSNNVLDESNVFVPYDPISPTQLTTDSSAPPSPAQTRVLHVSSPPIIHSPLPKTPIHRETLQSAVETQSELHEPFTPIWHTSRENSESPAARSGSSTSSFTPAVIGPSSSMFGYDTSRTSSAGSDAGRSTTYDIMSASGSGVTSPSLLSPQMRESSVTSPFETLTHPLSPSFNRSPSPVILSPVDSSLHLPSESDMAILSPSLRSGMFSPTLEDDPFEIASEIGSDDSLSGWESLGRKTPSP